MAMPWWGVVGWALVAVMTAGTIAGGGRDGEWPVASVLIWVIGLGLGLTSLIVGAINGLREDTRQRS